MCGIIAYTGKKEARNILLDGLRALEYRGYDSAGVYIENFGRVRAVGPVKNLEQKVPNDILGTTGIAHTRWATHGVPNESNAHPHSDESENIFVVHNGIIENYRELKSELENNGHIFSSDTDTEVVAHLFEEERKNNILPEQAFTRVLKKLRGTYGIALADKRISQTLFVARMGSPIVLGILEDGRIVASDPAPILRYTKDIIFLSDGEICIIKKNSHSIRTLDNEILEKAFEKISFDDTLSVKGGFKHFMLKEIFEMPEAVENSLRGRIIVEEGDVKLGGLSEISEKLSSIERIIIVGCGTSYYAGLCAENLIENLSGISVEVEIASEFRYKPQVINSKTLVIAISQSGETADTLEAMREAKRQNVLTLGIVNVVGSTIAREAGVGIYNHAGPEIGVASTKAFVSQVSVLALVALFLARRRGFSSAEGSAFIKDLISIPAQMRKLLERSSEIETIASKYARFENFLFIGRRSSLPMAYEGALKLKEVSYVHAEGYGAGEMKHGPLAMIDENFPTIALVPDDSMRMKTISNIEEIKARRGKVFAVATKSDPLINKISDDVFFIPKTNELLEPIIFAIPLYLFAYYTACHRNLDPDRPRNLAKSVTVE